MAKAISPDAGCSAPPQYRRHRSLHRRSTHRYPDPTAGRMFQIHHRRFTNLPCASRNDKPPRAITECQSSASPSTTSVRLKSLVKLLSCCNQPQQIDNFAFNLSPTGNTRRLFSDVFDGYLQYHNLPAITLSVQNR